MIISAMTRRWALALLLQSRAIYWVVCLNRSVFRADTSAVRFAEGLVRRRSPQMALSSACCGRAD